MTFAAVPSRTPAERGGHRYCALLRSACSRLRSHSGAHWEHEIWECGAEWVTFWPFFYGFWLITINEIQITSFLTSDRNWMECIYHFVSPCLARFSRHSAWILRWIWLSPCRACAKSAVYGSARCTMELWGVDDGHNLAGKLSEDDPINRQINGFKRI